MPSFDRQSALRAADKARRQGRTNVAIAEYLRIVEADPTDWNSANVLGDLYVKTRQIGKGVAQYTRIAEHLAEEGFHAKASALYKKILKIKPDEENALLQSGEMAARLGLLADARAAFRDIAARRAKRGDQTGAAAVESRIEALAGTPAAERQTTSTPVPLKSPAISGSESEPVAPEPAASVPVVAESLDEAFEQLRDEAEQDPSEKAAAEQYRLALTYHELGMLDDAIHALEEAVRSPRARFAAASLLGRLYRDRDDLHQAIDWFERALEAPASSREAGRALMYDLGAALESIGEHSRALAVFLELEAESRGYRDVSVRIGHLSQLQARG